MKIRRGKTRIGRIYADFQLDTFQKAISDNPLNQRFSASN
jgi:hypothetical protein